MNRRKILSSLRAKLMTMESLSGKSEKIKVAKRDALLALLDIAERIIYTDCPDLEIGDCFYCAFNNSKTKKCLRDEVEEQLKSVYELFFEMKEEA